jgi:hypothetical protein
MAKVFEVVNGRVGSGEERLVIAQQPSPRESLLAPPHTQSIHSGEAERLRCVLLRAAPCWMLASRPRTVPRTAPWPRGRSPGFFSPTSHAPRAPPVLFALSLSQNGAALPRASVSPTGAFDPRSVQHQELGGYVGLEVTSAPPHSVVMALDLLDANFITQGSAGNSNESVLPGDRILQVRLFRSVCCA